MRITPKLVAAASAFAIAASAAPAMAADFDVAAGPVYVVPGNGTATFITSGGDGSTGPVSASFSRSFAFEITKQSKEGEGGTEDIADAPKAPVDVVVSYADSSLLMSGWAMGAQQHIAGKPAMVRVPQGEGQVVLFAFRPQFRGQPRGTYKLIFNALLGGAMEEFPAAD